MDDLPNGSFRLEGYIEVPDDRIEAVRDALDDHVRLTRGEKGCIFFNVNPCPDHKGRFLVSEAFVDETAFKFHQTRAGSSPWAEVTAGIKRSYETWVVS
jgi:quinol monooxygenase YgiN